MIKDLKFIHFLTTAFIVEVFILILFKFTNQSSRAILNWYDNLGWTAIILDILSLIIGFYLSKYIYHYLIENNYLTKGNEFLKFLIIVLFVQILHDLCFYFFVIKPFPNNKNLVIDEFKQYAKYYGNKAVRADSLMYIVATPLLYYIIKNQKVSTNTFISIVSFYILGYLLYQKKIN
jgi:hypothetical protein